MRNTVHLSRPEVYVAVWNHSVYKASAINLLRTRRWDANAGRQRTKRVSLNGGGIDRSIKRETAEIPYQFVYRVSIVRDSWRVSYRRRIPRCAETFDSEHPLVACPFGRKSLLCPLLLKLHAELRIKSIFLISQYHLWNVHFASAKLIDLIIYASYYLIVCFKKAFI